MADPISIKDSDSSLKDYTWAFKFYKKDNIAFKKEFSVFCVDPMMSVHFLKNLPMQS